MQLIKKSIASLALLSFCLQINAQDEIKLSIGDPAPAIKYSKWLKGTPVTDYRNDRLYVLEFWATWCGPCIAAMPHLSELSEKYKDKATFIGVNVWEKTGDKPYESSLPAVTRFVESSANRMRYDVIVDNNALDMVNSWLKPAGVSGIPTTFVVKNSTIVWIGHPIKLDSIMDPIINGTFDVAAFKTKYETKKIASKKRMDDMQAAIKAVKDAAAEKDFEKAFLLVEKGIKENEILWFILPFEKFKILLNNFPEEEAFKYANELIKQNKSFATSIANEIIRKDDLSKNAYVSAVEMLKSSMGEGGFSAFYDLMALGFFKAGDIQSAVEAEEKAIAAAKLEVKDPKYEGRVFDYTITGYEETLKKYKLSVR